MLSLQKAGLSTVSNGGAARVTRPDAQHFIGELAGATLVPRNPLFNGVHQAVVQWLTEQRDVSLQASRAKAEAFGFHERIYDAIAAHDCDAAELAMKEHLESVSSFYWQQAMRRQKTGA